MNTLNTILQNARQRAQENNLPYAGALTPQEAFQVLELNPKAKLIDVRSHAELDLVGKIPQAAHVEWSFYPGWQPNPEFINQLKTQADTAAPTMFICRTGGRSHNAAVLATQSGYEECYNVIEGFEGATDTASKQRGKINGWKAAGLPWTNG